MLSDRDCNTIIQTNEKATKLLADILELEKLTSSHITRNEIVKDYLQCLNEKVTEATIVLMPLCIFTREAVSNSNDEYALQSFLDLELK